MDGINGRTNDKPAGFIPGGNGLVFAGIPTPRQSGCVYRQYHHCGRLFVCHYQYLSFAYRIMSKLYKVTVFGKPFILGWSSHADKRYHKIGIIY